MILEGECVKLGNDVDTDVILPGRYLTITDFHELGRHALEGLMPGFSEVAGRGVVVVAGLNFGCGSSREHAALALKHAGVRAVVAESFARIFYRNAFNVGLPAVECEGIHGAVESGDRLTIDLHRGLVKNQRTSMELRFNPIPSFMLAMLEEGGLIPYLKRRLAGEHPRPERS